MKCLSTYLYDGIFKFDVNPCPTGWIFNVTSVGCYYVSSTAKSWDASMKECASKSSCLANILSVDESAWIGTLTKSDTWVGGRRQGNSYEC